MHRVLIVTVLSALFGATPAAAHNLGAHGTGFGQGFAHPFAGIDHLLAMLAVGLWAAQLGGRARWAVPAAFVTAMAAGGLVGIAALPLPHAELGVAVSVLVLGLLIAGVVRASAAGGALVAGLFAVCHGHAHGSELLATAAWASHAAGFVAATVALHLTGLGLGRVLQERPASSALRYGGATIAAVGVALMLVG